MWNKKIMALYILMALSPQMFSQQLRVSITSPHVGDGVPWRTCFIGTVSDPSASVWLVLHPLSGDYYVQPRISVEKGKWASRVYIGERTPGMYEGLKFEARAFANPKGEMDEGQVLTDWPSGAATTSELVTVTRRDAASDGCSEYSVVYPPPAPNPPQSAVSSAHLGSSPIATTGRGDMVRIRIPRWAVVLLLFVWCVMAARPTRASSAINALQTALCAFAVMLREAIRKAISSLSAVSKGVWNWCKPTDISWKSSYWDACKAYVRDLWLWPLFALLFIPALLSDTVSIRVGLNLVFPDSVSAGAATAGGLLAGDASTSGVVDNPGYNDGGGPNAHRDTETPLSAIVHLLLRPELFGHPDVLLFVALGLAALQAAFGAVLLLGFRSAEAVTLSVMRLFKARPLLTVQFITLNITMTVLATFRGENAGGGVMPGTVAGLLAFVMPSVMALTLHCAMEAATGVVGPVAAVGLRAIPVLAAGLVVAVWFVALSTSLVMLACATLVGFAAPVGVVWCYFAFACVTGELIRDCAAAVRRWSRARAIGPLPGSRGLLAAATAGAVAIVAAVTLALTGSRLVK